MRNPSKPMTRLNTADKVVLLHVVGACLLEAVKAIVDAALGVVLIPVPYAAMTVGIAARIALQCFALIVSCAIFLVPSPRVTLRVAQFCGAICDIHLAIRHAWKFRAGEIMIEDFRGEQIEPTWRNSFEEFWTELWYRNRAVEIVHIFKRKREKTR